VNKLGLSLCISKSDLPEWAKRGLTLLVSQAVEIPAGCQKAIDVDGILVYQKDGDWRCFSQVNGLAVTHIASTPTEALLLKLLRENGTEAHTASIFKLLEKSNADH